MILEAYRTQVDLLLRILPYVAKEEIFALKGGTAINLFVHDLPRLSVDIDLTYLPLDSRDEALKNIHKGLGRIKSSIELAIEGLKVSAVSLNGDTDVKLNCQFPNAQIKIEVNTITRGHLFPVRLMHVTDRVQNEFGKFAAINVVSHAELYGSKICAALDRQHPRDMFDIKQFFDSEGLDDDVCQGFILSALSHNKPIHELLNPIIKDQKSAFNAQFAGMTAIEFSYEDYEKERKILIDIMNLLLSKDDKELILGFEKGEPDWNKFPHKGIKDFPAIKWKLHNINKLKLANPIKHSKLIRSLEAVLVKK
ncbi:MAG TPA: nucleotidyl transferase AbiEii/AbiGii toxin family protein [Bacteroidales bacterium]|nr:nucleotidyl transferase AbiEii/AbiGii toxin family protein [Bacteroidales bacterium]